MHQAYTKLSSRLVLTYKCHFSRLCRPVAGLQPNRTIDLSEVRLSFASVRLFLLYSSASPPAGTYGRQANLRDTFPAPARGYDPSAYAQRIASTQHTLPRGRRGVGAARGKTPHRTDPSPFLAPPLTASTRDDRDPTPTIPSFLLQLLLTVKC